MKALMIVDIDFSDNRMSGVEKKCNYIYNALLNNNIDTNYIYCKDFYLILKSVDSCYKKIYVTTENKYNIIFKIIEREKYDFIYIRHTLTNVFLLKFLEEVKMRKVKIIIEFPTLPYDEEITNKNLLDIDRYFRVNLKDYADLAITYNNVDSAFGINNIFIGNGIEVEDKKVLKFKPFNKKKINLIGVANVSKWHGYDRVIRGIYDYLQKDNSIEVKFIIVGEGDELPNLRSLVSKLGLNKNIKFYGFKSGQELEKIYFEADLGVGPLSRKRIGMNEGSALKNREYCAIGLPFIYAGYDPDFENYEYALNVEDNDTPIDIERIIKFVYNVKQNNQYITNMRSYAEEHLQWNKKIKNIIDELYK